MCTSLFFAVANRFVAEYGVVRLSIGEAIRKILNFQPYTELARQIKLHLRAGMTVPDELAVQALEVALLDMQCQTRGYVKSDCFVAACHEKGIFGREIAFRVFYFQKLLPLS